MACFTSEYEISTVSSAALAKVQPVARGEGLVPSIQCLPTTLFSLERKKPRVVSLLSSSSPESPIRWLNHTILKLPGFEREELGKSCSKSNCVGYEEKNPHDGGCTLCQDDQRSCRVSILKNIKKRNSLECFQKPEGKVAVYSLSVTTQEIKKKG